MRVAMGSGTWTSSPRRFESRTSVQARAEIQSAKQIPEFFLTGEFNQPRPPTASTSSKRFPRQGEMRDLYDRATLTPRSFRPYGCNSASLFLTKSSTAEVPESCANPPFDIDAMRAPRPVWASPLAIAAKPRYRFRIGDPFLPNPKHGASPSICSSPCRRSSVISVTVLNRVNQRTACSSKARCTSMATESKSDRSAATDHTFRGTLFGWCNFLCR